MSDICYQELLKCILSKIHMIVAFAENRYLTGLLGYGNSHRIGFLGYSQCRSMP